MNKVLPFRSLDIARLAGARDHIKGYENTFNEFNSDTEDNQLQATMAYNNFFFGVSNSITGKLFSLKYSTSSC